MYTKFHTALNSITVILMVILVLKYDNPSKEENIFDLQKSSKL